MQALWVTVPGAEHAPGEAPGCAPGPREGMAA
jgi:hypothetical protein